MRNCIERIPEMLSFICNPRGKEGGIKTSSWAELEPKVLSWICNRVSSFHDLVAFGGVCSRWRKVAVEKNFGQPLLPLPWLMLAENQHDDVREFYSVSEGKTYSLNLPGLRVKVSEAKTYSFKLPELKGKMCMETKGWIVTASRKGEMALVHPLTRVEIKLPHQNTSKCYYEFTIIKMPTFQVKQTE